MDLKEWRCGNMSIISKLLNMWEEGSVMDEVCMRIWNLWVNVKLVWKNGGKRKCYVGRKCDVRCWWNNEGVCDVDEDEMMRDIWYNMRRE